MAMKSSYTTRWDTIRNGAICPRPVELKDPLCKVHANTMLTSFMDALSFQ